MLILLTLYVWNVAAAEDENAITTLQMANYPSSDTPYTIDEVSYIFKKSDEDSLRFYEESEATAAEAERKSLRQIRKISCLKQRGRENKFCHKVILNSKFHVRFTFFVLNKTSQYMRSNHITEYF